MNIRPLSAEERFSWLQLTRTRKIGPITFNQLVTRYGSAAAALDALPCLAGGGAIPAPPDQVDREIDAAGTAGFRFIALCEPDYPEALRAITDAPPVICVKGNTELLSRHAVAIVGARNASAAGRTLAGSLAGDLGSRGVAIVSGLARGIDGAAHAGALKTGTIAVVAGGADILYPPEHRDLYDAIAQDGLVLSERPFGYQPLGKDFPRRNRIISGLSYGVIVVEAALRSGTLITARYALEQGRDVFAIPGSPLDPRSQGTNRLIRDGALLVESAEDVLDAMTSMSQQLRDYSRRSFRFDSASPAAIGREPALPGLRGRVRDLLSFSPVHRDVLVRQSGAGAADVNNILLELVLAGEASELPGARFTLPSGDQA